jgi:hypothetical protein
MVEHTDVEERLRTHFASSTLAGRLPGGSRADVQTRARRLRRRRQQAFGLVAGLALVGGGFIGAEMSDREPTTAVVASDPRDLVAIVPDSDRFEIVSATPPAEYDAPAGRFGNLTMYQQLNKDGSVAAAVAVGVVTSHAQQSTLLDLFPLDETVDGEAARYPLGDSDTATNGLVVVERPTGTHTIRVAGRNLDVSTVVAVLESVQLTDDGEIRHLNLPDGVPAEPIYDGPGASQFETVPTLSTSATYIDMNSFQQFAVATVRDRSVLPAGSLAWLFDGTVVPGSDPQTVIGRDHQHTHVAYWQLTQGTSVTVTSPKPLPLDLIQQIQTDSQELDAAAWNRLVEERLNQPDDTTVDTTTSSVP